MPLSVAFWFVFFLARVRMFRKSPFGGWGGRMKYSYVDNVLVMALLCDAVTESSLGSARASSYWLRMMSAIGSKTIVAKMKKPLLGNSGANK